MDSRYLLCAVAQLIVVYSVNISAVSPEPDTENKVESHVAAENYPYLSSYRKLLDENRLLRDVIDKLQEKQNATFAMEKHLESLEETTRQLAAQMKRNGPFLRHIRGLFLVEGFNTNHNWTVLRKGLVGLLDHSDVAFRQLQNVPSGDVKPMINVFRHGYLELLEVLLDYSLFIDTQWPYSSNNTFLHLAAWYNQPDMAKLLLERGANISARNNKRDTPLILAAFKNNIQMARLLKESGADINASANTGKTSLHFAAEKGFVEVVRYLVECGANTTVVDDDNLSPMELAKSKGHEEVVKIISQPST